MPQSRVPVLLGLLLGSALLAQSESGIGPRRPVFPGMEEEDARGWQREVVTRLVDATTGRPVGGGTMTAHREATHPLCGVSRPLAMARADDDGWVRMTTDTLPERPNFWVFEAEGFGPVGQHGELPEFPVRLRPGVDVAFVVRGPFGEPLGGAHVGLLLGCGHTPDVRSGRTDDAGRVTLRGIDPTTGELWVHAPGILGEYFDVELDPGGPTTLWCRPSRPVAGRVVDEAGEPVAGAFVGSPGCHRGPWSRTGADGGFRLLGAGDEADLYVHVPEVNAEGPLLVRAAPPAGSDLTLTIPANGEYRDDDGPAELEVAVVDPAGKPVDGVLVGVVRAADGYASMRRTRDQGKAGFSLQPGTFRLWMGSALGPWERRWHQEELVLTAEAGLAVTLRAEPRPRLRLHVQDLPDDGEVWLVTATSDLEVTDAWRSEGAVPVPAEGRLAVRLQAQGRHRVHEVPLEARRAGAAPFAAPWMAPTRLTARLTDARGAPLRGWIAAASSSTPIRRDALADHGITGPATETPECLTWWSGSRWLHFLPEAGEAAFVRPLVLPSEPGRTLDLGPLAAPDPDRVILTATLPDGSPAAGASLYLTRHGGAFQSWTDLDEAGRLRSTMVTPRAGDRLRLRAAGDPGARLLPLHLTLEGAEPWHLRWPSGGLELEVTGPEGQPLPSFEVILGDLTLEGGNGSLVVDGLPDGAHDVVVLSGSRRPAVRHFTIADGDFLRLAISLP